MGLTGSITVVRRPESLLVDLVSDVVEEYALMSPWATLIVSDEKR